VGLGVSYWNRTYSGADERSFLPNYPGDGDFSKGGVMPFLSAGVNLFEGLGVDGRIGIWSGSFTGEQALSGGLRINESIKQMVIPLTVGVYYAYKDVVPDQFNLFAGAGVNRYFVQNRAERNVSGGEGNVSSRTFHGNDYGFYFKLGGEYVLSKAFSLALDGRYNTGSYDKKYIPEFGAPSVIRNVSLQGLEIGLSLRYRFADLYQGLKKEESGQDEQSRR
ncbi:outer membrane beta-barrel protein, partial [Lunatibacter salilacus]|uniref:outer membrane beta-barrel protein n=1 Tax=Lunatibacter salilacus TaxID=2483804 RepID=UPI00131CF9B5